MNRTLNDAGNAAHAPTLRLGEEVLKHGLVTQQQLDEALAYQRQQAPTELLGKVLVDLGFVSQQDIVRVVAQAVGVGYVEPDPEQVDLEAVRRLPPRMLNQHNLLPLCIEDNQLKVAMEQFTDVFLIEDIAQRAGMPVIPVAATAQAIQAARSALNADQMHLDQLTQREPDADAADGELTLVEQPADDAENLEVAASDSPVVELVNQIIRTGIESRASDIHIEPDDRDCCVRLRIDGTLRQAQRIPPASVRAVVSRIKIMSDLDISERRKPQDGQLSVQFEQRKVDLRVSTMAALHGEKVVMRINDSANALARLDQLGLPQTIHEPWRGLIREPNGLVLVTGPTGSGKSSTLYASLSDIADRARNISTVEDPVEHSLPGINQFPVRSRVGFTFAQALRSLVRQDPDVIMVGEIRDLETARLAVEAALTGHLVLSTLHTNDAPGAITRLINMGVEPYLVAAALRGVMAQRLVPRLCPACAEPATPSDSTRRLFEHYLGPARMPEQTWASPGCARCWQSGVAGRALITELLEVDESLLEAVGRNATLQQIRQQARQRGFQSMTEHGLELVSGGQIALESLAQVLGQVTLQSNAAPAPEQT